MAIKLSHIGEPLVEGLANADLDRFYAKCELTHVPESDRGVATELKLAPWGDRAFDPVSRVDLGIRVGESLVTPVEIKLGLEGLSKRAIDERLVPWEASGHRDPRWKGSMMAILDRRYPGAHQGSTEPLKVIFHGRSMELTPDWIIVARREVIEAWRGNPPDFRSKVHFVEFEGWAMLVEEERFNSLVSSLLAINFYQEWVKPATIPR